MPGGNCAIYGCSSSRTTPGVSLFNVPSRKEDPYMINCRNKIVDIITRDRVIDSSLRSQIQNCQLHVCEFIVQKRNYSDLSVTDIYEIHDYS